MIWKNQLGEHRDQWTRLFLCLLLLMWLGRDINGQPDRTSTNAGRFQIVIAPNAQLQLGKIVPQSEIFRTDTATGKSWKLQGVSWRAISEPSGPGTVASGSAMGGFSFSPKWFTNYVVNPGVAAAYGFTSPKNTIQIVGTLKNDSESRVFGVFGTLIVQTERGEVSLREKAFFRIHSFPHTPERPVRFFSLDSALELCLLDVGRTARWSFVAETVATNSLNPSDLAPGISYWDDALP